MAYESRNIHFMPEEIRDAVIQALIQTGEFFGSREHVRVRGFHDYKGRTCLAAARPGSGGDYEDFHNFTADEAVALMRRYSDKLGISVPATAEVSLVIAGHELVLNIRLDRHRRI